MAERRLVALIAPRLVAQAKLGAKQTVFVVLVRQRGMQLGKANALLGLLIVEILPAAFARAIFFWDC